MATTKLGTLLDLTGNEIPNASYAWGTVIAGEHSSAALQGVITFHDAMSLDITVTVEMDSESDEAMGFAPINTICPGVGGADNMTRVPKGTAIEHTFSAGDGLTQRFWLQTEGLGHGARFRCGAKSAGAAQANDAVLIKGRGNVL